MLSHRSTAALSRHPAIRRKARAFGLACAAAALMPAGAMALTADDLLAAQNEMVRRLGFTPLGEITRTDGRIIMENAGGRMVLPYDWGEIGWRFGPIDLIEKDDAVAMSWDGGLEVTLDYRPHDHGPKAGPHDPRFTTVFTLTATDYQSRATGTADNITLTNSATTLDLRLTAADWWQAMVHTTPVPAGPDKGMASPPQIAMSLQDWSGTQTLTGFTAENTGPATITTSDDLSLIASQFTFIGPLGSENMASAQEDVASTLSLTLPATSLALRNIGLALHDGFAVSAQSTTAAGHSESTTRDGNFTSRQHHTTGASESRFGFDATNGLTLTADVADFALTIEDDLLAPTPWQSSAARFAFGLALPIMANGQREKASISVDLEDLRTDTGAFFGRNLPDAFDQIPFTFGLTLGADYEPIQDLVAFDALVDVLETQDVLRVYDFGIDRLEVLYDGASLTGGGRFSWGLYGAMLNDHLPNPKGRMSFALSGVYGLLNRLGQAQVEPPEFLTAARGAVAAFGQAKGPDLVESTIVLGPDGFTINGVPAPF